MISSLVAAATLATVFASPSPSAAAPQQLGWQDFATGATSSFRGLSAVSRRTAWVGGVGEVLRTVDGGATFQHVAPPDTAALQFRDVEAFDDQHAVILSIGEGDASRIYVTADGGTTWTETFRNDDPAAFYDCMAFLDRRHGLALSDPVGGKFRILSTSDGGATWSVVPSAGMPPALDGEFAFAASGTCISAVAGRHAWFATGGGASARVFRTDDLGLTWKVSATAIPSGPTAGIYSVVFRDPEHGITVGGDFLVPDAAPDNAARSVDGGRTWTLADGVPGEYRSGAAWTALPSVAIAVGPTGSDVTYDAGKTWQRFDTTSLHGVRCATDGACWASGAGGRVARLTLS
jgi:photosystem II stability/assembly factor-like uncharacterized protein